MGIRQRYKIGTSSFIIPAGWADNVHFLKDKVDHIMLLFLETGDDVCALPQTNEVDRLLSLQKTDSLNFSAHLPYNLHLGSVNEAERKFSVAAILEKLKFIDQTGLKIDHFVLHPDIVVGPDESDTKRPVLAFAKSIEEIVSGLPSGRKLALETLDFDFDLLEEIVSTYNLSVIVNISQCINYGHSYQYYTEKYLQRIVDIHLPGLESEKDRQSVEHIDSKTLKQYFQLLEKLNYKGNLLIEVHSQAKLESSYNFLDLLDTIN